MRNPSIHGHVLRAFWIFATAALLAGAAGVALAQPASSSPGKGKKYVATKEIVFDAATGKLRKPTVEETQALVSQISTLTNRSAEGLTVKQHQNGMKSMNLAGRFGGVILGRANEDGTVEIRCVMTLEEAVGFLGLEEDTAPQQ